METIETKFQELAAISPNPPEIDITDLHNLAEKAKAIVEIDIHNAEQMLEVTTVRKELAEARKSTVEFTEAARERSYTIYKGVLEIKNTLLEIITPEEDRLKAAEKELKEFTIMESRREGLADKLEKLQVLAEGFSGFQIPSEEDILKQDDATFLIWVTEQQSLKNAQKEAELAAAQAKLDAERAEADRIEKAREEERRLAEERVEQEKANAAAEVARIKAEAEAAEAERLQAIEDAKAAEEERVAKEKEEAEKAQAELEANKRFQAWLKKHSYSEENGSMMLKDEGNCFVLYKFVDKFDK